MLRHNYHCIAAFLDGRIAGVAGYWLGARFYCGEYMDVDNVVVDADLCSQGIGSKMMDWLHAKVADLGSPDRGAGFLCHLRRGPSFLFPRGLPDPRLSLHEGCPLMTKITVRVTPNARRNEIIGWDEPDRPEGPRVLRIKLCVPPVEGRANRELYGLSGRTARAPQVCRVPCPRRKEPVQGGGDHRAG